MCSQSQDMKPAIRERNQQHAGMERNSCSLLGKGKRTPHKWTEQKQCLFVQSAKINNLINSS